MLHLTDQNFETEVRKASGITLVEFWAEWCQPCRAVAPILEALAEEYQGTETRIAKLNVDENQGVASRYGVMSIPTFLLFKNGQVVDQLVGGTTKEVLRGKIEKQIEV